MKTMTWQEIEKDWGGLQKKHRMEIAQAVARYCIGHKMAEVAEKLGYKKTWVCTQLDFAGVGATVGGVSRDTPLPVIGVAGQQRSADTAVSKVVKEFAPSISVKTSDDGKGNQSIVGIEGDDAEAFEPYVAHYMGEGHEPAAATRLAKAEWAAEAAVEAGVIKETTNKKNERVNQILFPDQKAKAFDLDHKMHMARMKSAAKFYDEAKVSCLRRESTCEGFAAAFALLAEQSERMQSFSEALERN